MRVLYTLVVVSCPEPISGGEIAFLHHLLLFPTIGPHLPPWRIYVFQNLFQLSHYVPAWSSEREKKTTVRNKTRNQGIGNRIKEYDGRKKDHIRQTDR